MFRGSGKPKKTKQCQTRVGAELLAAGVDSTSLHHLALAPHDTDHGKLVCNVRSRSLRFAFPS